MRPPSREKAAYPPPSAAYLCAGTRCWGPASAARASAAPPSRPPLERSVPPSPHTCRPRRRAGGCTAAALHPASRSCNSTPRRRCRTSVRPSAAGTVSPPLPGRASTCPRVPSSPPPRDGLVSHPTHRCDPRRRRTALREPSAPWSRVLVVYIRAFRIEGPVFLRPLLPVDEQSERVVVERQRATTGERDAAHRRQPLE